MMYSFKMKPRYPEVERLMDEMLIKPIVIIKEPKQASKLGQIAKPLRDEGVLHISQDKKLHGETIAFLKINNVNGKKVKKKKGRNIEYLFENMMIPPNIY